MIWVEYFSFVFIDLRTCKYLTKKQNQTHFKTCEDGFKKQMNKVYECLMIDMYTNMYTRKNELTNWPLMYMGF